MYNINYIIIKEKRYVCYVNMRRATEPKMLLILNKWIGLGYFKYRLISPVSKFINKKKSKLKRYETR